MTKAKVHESRIEIPPFDEAILAPTGDEVVRAVRTSPLHEFQFEEYCKSIGLTTYLPLRKALKFHNVTRNGKGYSYSKEVLRPLFASYLFVKVPLPQLRRLFDSKLILQILAVSDMQKFLDEIRTVRKFEVVGFGQPVEIHQEIAVGKRFLINSGIWQGTVGLLTKKDNLFTWTVEIEFCNQFLSTQIDPTEFQMTPYE